MKRHFVHVIFNFSLNVLEERSQEEGREEEGRGGKRTRKGKGECFLPQKPMLTNILDFYILIALVHEYVLSKKMKYL